MTAPSAPGCVPGASPGVDESWLVVEKTKNGGLTDTVVAPVPVANGAACHGTELEGVGGGDQPLQLSRSVAEELSTSEGGRGTVEDGETGCDGAAATECKVGQEVVVQRYGRGVVRWVGEVRGERVAGIELDEYREGCGNGCLPGSEKPLFSCPEGHGVFTPISEVTPDPMFMEQVDHTSPVTKRPTHLFEEGSMVEVRGYGFGVVQWLGHMRGRDTAGVELEEFREQCGDGTPEGGEKMLFPCPPGHSVFTPVDELVPDSRFQSVESVNPLSHLSLEVISKVAIPGPGHYSRGELWGVQGEHNSCYIDATLFSLFALSSEFDDILTSHHQNNHQEGGPQGNHQEGGPQSNHQEGGPQEEVQRDHQGEVQGTITAEICTTLSSHIINPLRKNGVLRYEPIHQLRDQLDQLERMTGLKQEEKDPEEFLNMLFKHVLSIEPFISIQRPQGEEGEFFVQLFMEPDPSLKHPPSISLLLSRMFSEQNIKFSKFPNKLLIQVPRYGKQFKTFQRIIPDKTLHLKELCTSECLTTGTHKLTAQLKLLSVLCIETSHYVCFTRSDNRWIFMDSMADRVDDCYNIPMCNDCTDELERWVYGDQSAKLLKQSAKKLPDLVRRFTQDVYMCVYIEYSTAV